MIYGSILSEKGEDINLEAEQINSNFKPEPRNVLSHYNLRQLDKRACNCPKDLKRPYVCTQAHEWYLSTLNSTQKS